VLEKKELCVNDHQTIMSSETSSSQSWR
jgi:hypothetical protein